MISMDKGVMGMIKRFMAVCVLVLLLLQTGCTSEVPVTTSEISSYKADGVTITDKGNYYDVVLDFTTGLSHRQIGESFAKGILKMVPDYEALVDSYIAENLVKSEYKYAFYRMEDIKSHVAPVFAEEIEGMASVFSGGDTDIRSDNKISKNEFYLFNLFTDAIRGSQCCYVSVYGERSETKKTITGRNLDWYGGRLNQLPRIQAVINFIYPDKKVCSIGYMGFMGILSGFNDSRIFAGILDAGTNAAYSSEGRCSYVFDLRHALESTSTMNDAAEYMRDPKKLYAYNHIIGFSDPESSIILENNFSGMGSEDNRVKRSIRKSDSKLNQDITWGISDAVASVNSFILYGNNDNHTPNKYNTKRWDNIKTQLQNNGNTVSVDKIKKTISFYSGRTPGVFSESGDIYNKMTIQMIVFQPASYDLQVFFRPKNNRVNPALPAFEHIEPFK
jgi:hypothetical protein